MRAGPSSLARRRQHSISHEIIRGCPLDLPGTSQIKFDSAACGRVVANPLDPGYDGATRASNNTGELTALLQAVRWEASQGSVGPVLFCVDSIYAIAMATGRWVPRRKNRELARRVQVEYARLRASRGYDAVSILHVRAHPHEGTR